LLLAVLLYTTLTLETVERFAMGEMGPSTDSFDVEDVLSELNVDEKIALLSGRSSILA
jgi:hypothetical protein